jgi:hypothetical protein
VMLELPKELAQLKIDNPSQVAEYLIQHFQL